MMEHPGVVEAYLKAGVRPRWMERVAEIDYSVAALKRDYARRYRRLAEECGTDADAFAERWRAIAADARYDELNELIEQHNAWYPIERDLPMDLRTRDYVLINGRSYRRPAVGPDWVLQHFPRSEEHTSELQSLRHLVCRLLLE